MEVRVGLSPDGGSGLLEFLAAAITLAIGIALTILAWVGPRGAAQRVEYRLDVPEAKLNRGEPRPCLAETSYTCKMSDLAKSWIRTFPMRPHGPSVHHRA